MCIRDRDWEAQWACAFDPETAKAIRDDRSPEHDDTCSMCGKFCAVRSMNKALAGEHIAVSYTHLILLRTLPYPERKIRYIRTDDTDVRYDICNHFADVSI